MLYINKLHNVMARTVNIIVTFYFSSFFLVDYSCKNGTTFVSNYKMRAFLFSFLLVEKAIFKLELFFVMTKIMCSTRLYVLFFI